MKNNKKQLSNEQNEELIQTLKTRFEKIKVILKVLTGLK